jgi:hypothetical protein
MICPICNSSLEDAFLTKKCWGKTNPFYHEFYFRSLDNWSLFTNYYTVIYNDQHNYRKIFIYDSGKEKEIDLPYSISLDKLLDKIQLLLTFL